MLGVRTLLLLLLLCSTAVHAQPAAMRNVAEAIGVRQLARLPDGLVLHESRSGGATTSAVITVDAAGRVRQSTIGRNGLNEWLYDGTSLWMVDPTRTSSKRGVPVPVGQALLEKTLLPVWVRSGYWASADAPLDISVAGETDDAVMLALQLRGGNVKATVEIDRKTWLPTRLSVPYDRGPFVMQLSDVQRVRGMAIAGRVRTEYADSKSESRLTFAAPVPNDGALLLRTLPRPIGTSFDRTASAQVPVVRGPAESDGRPGHAFVRPLVDGRDVGPFHFDTGAPSMSIDVRIADELGMAVVGEAEAVGADGVVRKVTVRQGKSFALGPILIENPLFLAEDMSRMSAPAGERRAGFCGYPLFVRAVFEFADGGKAIAVHDPATYALDGGEWLDMAVRTLTPSIMATVNGRHRGRFLVDTGVHGAVTLNAAFAEGVRTLDTPREESMSGSGGTTRVRTATLPSFAFAGFRSTAVPVIIRIAGQGSEATGVDGVIGRLLMEGKTVIFDYGRQRIAVALRNNQPRRASAEIDGLLKPHQEKGSGAGVAWRP